MKLLNLEWNLEAETSSWHWDAFLVEWETHSMRISTSKRGFTQSKGKGWKDQKCGGGRHTSLLGEEKAELKTRLRQSHSFLSQRAFLEGSLSEAVSGPAGAHQSSHSSTSKGARCCSLSIQSGRLPDAWKRRCFRDVPLEGELGSDPGLVMGIISLGCFGNALVSPPHPHPFELWKAKSRELDEWQCTNG